MRNYTIKYVDTNNRVNRICAENQFLVMRRIAEIVRSRNILRSVHYRDNFLHPIDEKVSDKRLNTFLNWLKAKSEQYTDEYVSFSDIMLHGFFKEFIKAAVNNMIQIRCEYGWCRCIPE